MVWREFMVAFSVCLSSQNSQVMILDLNYLFLSNRNYVLFQKVLFSVIQDYQTRN